MAAQSLYIKQLSADCVVAPYLTAIAPLSVVAVDPPSPVEDQQWVRHTPDAVGTWVRGTGLINGPGPPGPRSYGALVVRVGPPAAPADLRGRPGSPAPGS